MTRNSQASTFASSPSIKCDENDNQKERDRQSEKKKNKRMEEWPRHDRENRETHQQMGNVNTFQEA